jgi:N-dimethylarginine dimethylaminohydrolase
VTKTSSSQSSFLNFSEFAATPPILIVHNPAEAGAFRAMEEFHDPSRLETEFLFRELPDIKNYDKQHRSFTDLLGRHVDKVICLENLLGKEEVYKAAKTNPNKVFTRDSVITFPWIPNGYISAGMKRSLRQQEVTTMKAAVEKLGLSEITNLPEGLILEGGDVIPFSFAGERSLLVGYGQRTQVDAVYFLGKVLIPELLDQVIGIELAEWRMNLDGGLVPVTDDIVISDTRSIRSAFILDKKGRREADILRMFRDQGKKIIDVSREESVFSQACNCICLGSRKIIYYDLCPRVSEILTGYDVEVLHVAGSELVKGRGGPRCMTRPVYTKLS